MSPPVGFDVKPVYIKAGTRLLYANNFLSNYPDYYYQDDKRKSKKDRCGKVRKNRYRPIRIEKDRVVKPCDGDIFLGLDLGCGHFPKINPILQEMRRTGVKVYFIVYDLIPLLYPWHTKRIKAEFKHWIRGLTQHANGLICISSAVADEVEEWVKKYPPTRESVLDVNYFHLGADIKSSLPSKGFPKGSESILNDLSKCPTFLMVGTLEPRKGHAQALHAFDLLWEQGADVNLVIVGQQGWHTETLVAEIQAHNQLGKRLFWLNGISDEFLEKIYQKSDALLASSEAEGFGLPLIEAAQHKLPIIARNIPVFKEIAGTGAYYFEGVEQQAIASAITEWVELNENKKSPQSNAVQWLTWEESTQQLLDILIE